VRSTLGCTCPDEVFRSIVLQRRGTANAPGSYARLVIGDRLLIYVHEARPGEGIAAAVAALTTQGLAEREAQAYNRFRLVIAAEALTRGPAEAAESFSGIVGRDDRAHLHVLCADQLPDSIRSA